MSSYQKELLRHALAFARAGYHVFPLTVLWDPDKGKKRLIIPFPHAEGWNVVSTTDEDQIHEWFDTPRKGMKGVAIDTGKSGIAAIDLDKSDTVDGFAEWAKLPEQQETPMTVNTRSGGSHRMYRDPSGRIGVSAGQVAPGIDIRGRGGFVITAPTRVFGTEGVYTIPNGLTPVAELPALTPGMIEVITARQEPDRPKFDPAIHGSYKVSISQGEEVLKNRLARLKEGRGMRAAIFGYAVGVAQFEGAKAAKDDATLDEDTLAAYIGEQILSVVPWEELDEEDRQWIADGVTKGLAQPWEIVADDEVLPEVEADVPLVELLQREARKMPGHPRTAHALAAPVVVDELVGRYLYVEGLGWHEWVGDRWSPEIRVPVRHAVQRAIQHHRAEARRMVDAVTRNEEFQAVLEEHATLKESDAGGQRLKELAETIDRVNAWVEAWETNSSWWYGLANGRDYDQVMKFVEADPGKVYIRASELDRDPNQLNCPNGTVDLRTGIIRRHDPGDFITKSTNVPYDPKATHPLWDRARESFAPGIEAWLQLKVGEGAFGFPSNDDTMLFNFGQGSNGKSTLSDAILRSLGDYAVFLHDKAVLGNEHDHSTEKMIFRGARWAVLEELPEAQVLRPAVIKKLIGTSKITARRMRQDNVTFDATHSILVNSNHRPQVLENDRGTWRRLIAVPWPWTFKFAGEALDDEWERVADPTVKHGLARDIEVQKAALAWIVAGAVRFTEAGGTCGELPEVVRKETESWRMESDTFGTFFDQELVIDKTAVVSSKELLESYNEWLADLGKRAVSDSYIANRLSTMKAAKGVHKKQVLKTAKGVTPSTRGVFSELPARFLGWVGVRWLSDAEKVQNHENSL